MLGSIWFVFENYTLQIYLYYLTVLFSCTGFDLVGEHISPIGRLAGLSVLCKIGWWQNIYDKYLWKSRQENLQISQCKLYEENVCFDWFKAKPHFPRTDKMIHSLWTTDCDVSAHEPVLDWREKLKDSVQYSEVGLPSAWCGNVYTCVQFRVYL